MQQVGTPMLSALLAAAVASTALSQSITGEVRAASQLTASASLPALPSSNASVVAGTLLPNAFASVASVGLGQAIASSHVYLQASPVLYRLEQATSAAATGFASCGVHDTRLRLTVTREYGGDVVIRWNGIEQNDGTGALSVAVDVGDDGSFEYQGSDGQVATLRVTRAWGPAAPLPVLVRTSAQCGDPAVPSAFKGIVEIAFEPDAATVALGSFTPFGFGCGTAVTPAPLLFGASVPGPLVGRPFSASVSFLPANTLAVVMMVGTTEIPPLDLAPIGMELCFLFAIPDIGLGVPVPLPGQPALWTIGVPNRTDLVGYRFVTQALVVVPTVAGLGVVLSNPGRGVIGAD